MWITLVILCLVSNAFVQAVKIESSSSYGKNESFFYDYYVSQASSPDCARQLIKSDNCVKDALFIGKELKPPQSVKEIDDYCGKLRETIECVTQYRRCLNTFTKTLFLSLVRDVKRKMKQICSSTEKKRETLGHLKCFRGMKSDFYYGIINSFTHVLVNISGPGNDPQAMIPKSCCAYHILQTHMLAIVEKECQPRTQMETGKFIFQLIESIVNALTDLACAKHNSAATCVKLMPKESAMYLQLMREGFKKRYNFAPTMPVVQIARTLDSGINLR